MTITVGDIYTAFPNFNPKDIITMLGSKDFDGKTVVPLSRIAALDNKNLSIFATQKEKDQFTNLLSEARRPEYIEAAGLQTNNKDNKKNGNSQAIPMNKSIFDIDAQKKLIT